MSVTPEELRRWAAGYRDSSHYKRPHLDAQTARDTADMFAAAADQIAKLEVRAKTAEAEAEQLKEDKERLRGLLRAVAAESQVATAEVVGRLAADDGLPARGAGGGE